MDYENKEDQFHKRGNLFLEISAIMIFVLLILFAGVVYHFYTEVNRLYDDKQELLSRIEAFEQRPINLGINQDFNRLRKEQIALRRQVTKLEAEARDSNAANADIPNNEIEDLQARVGELEKLAEAGSLHANPGNGVVVSKGKRRKVINDIQVDLASCSEKMMYVYCDISLEALGDAGRRVEISNQSTLLEDEDGITYPISSFSLGTGSKNEVRHKATVFVSKTRPVKLRFRFFEPAVGTQSFSLAQFQIDGTGVPFEEVRVER
ncbi:hypothetical protein [Roseibium sp.]|uniref:hypothetical protein n=1 Tax=Roseibium sp. TaxID=1936156 RepID=UPI003BA8AB0C